MSREKIASRSFAPALVLLIVAVFINYVDRGNLSLAAPLLKQEWGLSPTQLGVLLSSFFWTYTALQIPVGWLADRFNVSIVLGVGFLIWSLSTAASALATGFATLLVLRLCLGVGESVMFPATSKICAQQLPEEARGLANGLLCAAMHWGVALGTLGGGLLIARYGWRITFVAIGLVSLAWLPAWTRWKPATLRATLAEAQSTPSVWVIASKRAFWAASAGHFCANFLLYLLLTWMPYYLVQGRHQSMTMMAWAVGAIWTADSVFSIATGWLSDWFIRRGTTATKARKTAMAVGYGWATLSLIALTVAGPHTYWISLVGVATGSGIANAGTYAFGQTLAGPHVAGKWIGMQNGVANLAGIVGPALTGLLVDRTGHFAAAFAVTAVVTLMGGFVWVVGRLEQVEWGYAELQLAPDTVSAE